MSGAAGEAHAPARQLSDASRWLIVNADDFGLSAGVNEGIIAAHERGIVTSASLMVRWPAAIEAAGYAINRKSLSVGLHIDLGEWQCVAGDWHELYSVVAMDDTAAVTAEVRRQLGVFRELMGREPTHIDSHQHVHREEPIRAAVLGVAGEIGVPVRDITPAIRYCGGFYGQANDGVPWPEGISRAGLLRILEELPPGVTELGCHPGFDDHLQSMYRDERRREVEVLCDPEIAAAIERLGIRLVSFADVGSRGVARP
jgi:predicted glycoside hydrolase/deacetylase ChbG (UPF0249 family)